jgi:peroxiredoxin
MKTITELHRRTSLATASILTLSAVIMQAISGASLAGKFNRALDIGDPAPAWSDLEGVDGRRRALADFADAKLLVLVFTCNHCPVATANQDRLIALQKQFADRGVQLVAICSNPGEVDDLPAMKERAKAAAFNFPYLRDADQAAAQAYGATKTPTALVLDGDRKVRYMGAIDDNWQSAADVERDYLRDAVEALLAGRTVPISETRPIGCEIPQAEAKTSQTTR